MKKKYRLARWLGHRFWLRGRGRLILSLCPPEKHTGEEFNVDFFGHNYHGFLDDFIDRQVYIYGGYELNTLVLMSQLVKGYRTVRQGPITYVDVGANTGQHAIFMSRYADRVTCFEPFEPVRRRLEDRIAHNNIDNVTVYPLALSAQEGTSFYYPPEGSNQGQGSLVSELPISSRPAPITVKTDVGDNYFADHSNAGITILKIDVEGSEVDVLEGFGKTLLRYRPAVILELSEYTREKAGSLAQLTELIYPDAAVFTIGKTAWRVDYRLQECDFRHSALENILIIPSELSTAFPHCASFASVLACPPSLADRHGT